MTDRCKANPCCGNMGGGCDIPLPQDDSGFPGRNTQWEVQIKAGAKSVNEARAMLEMPEVNVPDAGITPGADNFLIVMQKLPAIVEGAKAGFTAAGLDFAKSFAELGPHMESLTPDQSKAFLAYFEASMNSVNEAVQKAMEACLEAI